MQPRKPLVQVAEEHVPFATAASWVGMSVSDRGFRYDCPAADCGSGGAFKAYPDHGWCHSCRTYFTAVKLLAALWRPARDMEPEDVARLALTEIGYAALDYAGEWEAAQQAPDPEREYLGDALRIWCRSNIPDWASRQLDYRPAYALALCLGLLPRVHTDEEAERWLARCKQVLARSLGGIT